MRPLAHLLGRWKAAGNVGDEDVALLAHRLAARCEAFGENRLRARVADFGRRRPPHALGVAWATCDRRRGPPARPAVASDARKVLFVRLRYRRSPLDGRFQVLEERIA